MKASETFLDAIIYDDAEKAASCLRHGSSPDSLDAEGRPILALAASLGRAEIAEILLARGADPNASGGLPLSLAVTSHLVRDPSVIAVLLEAGAEMDASRASAPCKGGTSLMAAMATMRPDLARFLLWRGARLDVADDSGETPLSLAARLSLRKLAADMAASGRLPEPRTRGLKDFLETAKSDPLPHDCHLERRVCLAPAVSGPHVRGTEDVSSYFSGSRFPGCSAPPEHALSLALEEFPDLPVAIKSLGVLHVIAQSCDECSQAAVLSFNIEGDSRLSALGETEVRKCARQGDAPRSRPRRLAPAPDDSPWLARAGGLPEWIAPAAWPPCPDCGRPMFYLVETKIKSGGADNPAAGPRLFSFVCAECAIATEIRQG